jgi:hypothetical protein
MAGRAPRQDVTTASLAADSLRRGRARLVNTTRVPFAAGSAGSTSSRSLLDFSIDANGNKFQVSLRY